MSMQNRKNNYSVVVKSGSIAILMILPLVSILYLCKAQGGEVIRGNANRNTPILRERSKSLPTVSRSKAGYNKYLTPDSPGNAHRNAPVMRERSNSLPVGSKTKKGFSEILNRPHGNANRNAPIMGQNAGQTAKTVKRSNSVPTGKAKSLFLQSSGRSKSIP